MKNGGWLWFEHFYFDQSPRNFRSFSIIWSYDLVRMTSLIQLRYLQYSWCTHFSHGYMCAVNAITLQRAECWYVRNKKKTRHLLSRWYRVKVRLNELRLFEIIYAVVKKNSWLMIIHSIRDILRRTFQTNDAIQFTAFLDISEKNRSNYKADNLILCFSLLRFALCNWTNLYFKQIIDCLGAVGFLSRAALSLYQSYNILLNAEKSRSI